MHLITPLLAGLFHTVAVKQALIYLSTQEISIMRLRGPARHTVRSLKENGFSIESVKEWRSREHEAGRPAGWKDFFRSHGLCAECESTGEKILGWDGERYLLETCEACAGTGKSTAR